MRVCFGGVCGGGLRACKKGGRKRNTEPLARRRSHGTGTLKGEGAISVASVSFLILHAVYDASCCLLRISSAISADGHCPPLQETSLPLPMLDGISESQDEEMIFFKAF